jgi:tetratricopeptide (TPR) repeat protein
MFGQRGRGLVVSLVLAVGLIAPTARADDTAKAKKLFKQAEEKFAASDYDGARALYEAAYELKPLPGFLLNIGQCFRKMGRCDRAIDYYRRFLESSTNARLKADAQRLIDVCQEELAKKPSPSPAPSPAPEQKPEEQPPLEPAPSQPAPEPGPRPARRGLSPILFWSGVGVTGALLLTGTFTGAVALSKSELYRDVDTPYGDLQDLRDTGTALKTTSTVTFVLGGIAAVATTVLYFYTDFGPKERSVAAAPVEGGGVLVVEGRF